MIAPSFADFPIVKEQYIKNGKYYVDVKNPSTGTVRSVRWYSDAEYAKNYGKDVELKNTRGFEKGPILVIRGVRSTDKNWLNRSGARYAIGIGWYFASTDVVPPIAPAHFKYLLLGWDEFKAADNHAKKPTELVAILEKKAVNKEWIKVYD